MGWESLPVTALVRVTTAFGGHTRVRKEGESAQTGIQWVKPFYYLFGINNRGDHTTQPSIRNLSWDVQPRAQPSAGGDGHAPRAAD